MKTPVVTLKVSPFELQAIDDALHLMHIASADLARSVQKGGRAAASIDDKVIIAFILDVAVRSAEGDPRRIPIRMDKLRESIGLA